MFTNFPSDVGSDVPHPNDLDYAERMPKMDDPSANLTPEQLAAREQEQANLKQARVDKDVQEREARKKRDNEFRPQWDRENIERDIAEANEALQQAIREGDVEERGVLERQIKRIQEQLDAHNKRHGFQLNEKSITKSKSQSRRPVVGKYGGRYGSMGRNKDSVGMVGRGTSSPEPAENPNLIQITAENWESLGMPQDAIGAYVRKVEGTSKGPYHTVDQMLNKIFKASKKGGEVKVVNTGIYGNIGPENNPPKERYGPAVGGATKDKATTPYTDEKGEKESSLEDNDGDGGGDGGE